MEIEQQLAVWEKVAFDNEASFLETFTCKGEELIGVWWSSNTMRINYLAPDGQTIVTSRPLIDWFEWYDNKNYEAAKSKVPADN